MIRSRSLIRRANRGADISLNNPNDISGAGWSKIRVTAPTSYSLIEDGPHEIYNYHYMSQSFTNSLVRDFGEVTFEGKPNGRRYVCVYTGGNSYAVWDLQTGTITASVGHVYSRSFELADGFWSMTFACSNFASASSLHFYLSYGATEADTYYASDGVSGIFVRAIRLRAIRA